eukprot:10212234-Alexandrium_andersonii.AAC.1
MSHRHAVNALDLQISLPEMTEQDRRDWQAFRHPTKPHKKPLDKSPLGQLGKPRLDPKRLWW